jgi:hypothetical protein
MISVFVVDLMGLPIDMVWTLPSFVSRFGLISALKRLDPSGSIRMSISTPSSTLSYMVSQCFVGEFGHFGYRDLFRI